MKRIFLLLTLILMLPVSAFAVNPDDFIDLQFRQVVKKERKPTYEVPPVVSTPSRSDGIRTWTEPSTGMEFVWVPGGCFRMGQTESERQWLIKEVGQEKYDRWYKDEQPRHKVCVDGFWMGRFEVTRGQFRKFVRATGYKTTAEIKGKAKIFNKSTEWKWKEMAGYNWLNLGHPQDDSHPVAAVSMKDAKAYISWMQKRSGVKLRLPREAEWEYACRAGSTTKWFWGDNEKLACSYANGADKSRFPGDPGRTWNRRFECNDGHWSTAPVGSYKPNRFGLYDMLGNVWEWCEDSYDKNAYTNLGMNNPQSTRQQGKHKNILRGGSWVKNPRSARSAKRAWSIPVTWICDYGFRIVRVP